MEDRQVNLTKNDEILMSAIKQIDPDLALIKIYLMHTKINPKIIPIIVDQLSLIDNGSGYGSVVINVFDRKIISCRGTDDRTVDLEMTI